jgi:hypothetical protein
LAGDDPSASPDDAFVVGADQVSLCPGADRFPELDVVEAAGRLRRSDLRCPEAFSSPLQALRRARGPLPLFEALDDRPTGATSSVTIKVHFSFFGEDSDRESPTFNSSTGAGVYPEHL